MQNGAYRRLIVWRKARDLAVEIVRATASPSFRRDWALRDQMRRAAISVPSNIAEGNERGSPREMARFCHFAKGSVAELSTQVEIAAATDYVDIASAARWQAQCEELARMLASLIRVHTQP